MTFDWEAAREQVRRASDWHSIRAASFFNVPYECVTPKQRAYAKTLNYVHFYTPGAFDHKNELFGLVCVYHPEPMVMLIPPAWGRLQ